MVLHAVIRDVLGNGDDSYRLHDVRAVLFDFPAGIHVSGAGIDVPVVDGRNNRAVPTCVDDFFQVLVGVQALGAHGDRRDDPAGGGEGVGARKGGAFEIADVGNAAFTPRDDLAVVGRASEADGHQCGLGSITLRCDDVGEGRKGGHVRGRRIAGERLDDTGVLGGNTDLDHYVGLVVDHVGDGFSACHDFSGVTRRYE